MEASGARAMSTSPTKTATSDATLQRTLQSSSDHAPEEDYASNNTKSTYTSTLNRPRPGLSQRTLSGLSVTTQNQLSTHESESDSGYRSEDKPGSVRRLFAGSGAAATGSIKKHGDGLSKTVQSGSGSNAMTVETETVTTVASVAVGASAQGSVRSSKNPNPRNSVKGKKKKPKPLPHIQGTSRADIFAAKIASAVDDNDSDDSDETFVYESNTRDISQSARFQDSRSPSLSGSGGGGGGGGGQSGQGGGSERVQGAGGGGAGLRNMLEPPRSGGSINGNSIKNLDPRSLNSIYSSTKSMMAPPASPRPFPNRGAASAVAHDGYADDNDTGADGDDDFDDDETALLSGASRRVRAQRRRNARSEARKLRRSMLTTCMVVLALIIGFSLGVVYVTS
ncbi:vacuolar segregation subunit 7-domain-containing protein [Myxozyma melibiosi]|uniref:Vacuolar segregation subunit 7-domain-containing protein n=1 Tax=Myxozyma melibiosi TaxID=54550 RepID=A0ABR1FFU9_9ASCO